VTVLNADTPNTLRIDRGDGSPIIDYRIENGRVKSRTVDRESVSTDFAWQPLTREQLSAHVLSSTVVAQWLRHRMGLHRLLRTSHPCGDNALPHTERLAA